MLHLEQDSRTHRHVVTRRNSSGGLVEKVGEYATRDQALTAMRAENAREQAGIPAPAAIAAATAAEATRQVLAVPGAREGIAEQRRRDEAEQRTAEGLAESWRIVESGPRTREAAQDRSKSLWNAQAAVEGSHAARIEALAHGSAIAGNLLEVSRQSLARRTAERAAAVAEVAAAVAATSPAEHARAVDQAAVESWRPGGHMYEALIAGRR